MPYEWEMQLNHMNAHTILLGRMRTELFCLRFCCVSFSSCLYFFLFFFSFSFFNICFTSNRVYVVYLSIRCMFVRTHRILFWCFASSITAERYVLCVGVVFYTANPFGCNAWCVFQVMFRSLCELRGIYAERERNRVLIPIFWFFIFFEFRVVFLFDLKSDHWSLL